MVGPGPYFVNLHRTEAAKLLYGPHFGRQLQQQQEPKRMFKILKSKEECVIRQSLWCVSNVLQRLSSVEENWQFQKCLKISIKPQRNLIGKLTNIPNHPNGFFAWIDYYMATLGGKCNSIKNQEEPWKEEKYLKLKEDGVIRKSLWSVSNVISSNAFCLWNISTIVFVKFAGIFRISWESYI